MKRRKSPAKSQQSGKNASFRIIGGQWRGRRLAFPEIQGLRPTPDRVRETLFNWLAGELQNARCLDLFCGSGALGLEALSRGAGFCLFVDSNPEATGRISQHLLTLPDATGDTLQARIPECIAQIDDCFDVVFLDPPYQDDCLGDCLEAITSKGLLHDKTWVYLECSSASQLPVLDSSFDLYRHKRAGQVQYALYRFSKAGLS